jgi:DNA-binding transcriptional LysR family regulator
MELRHLRYFLAVAEELHFGHAAERVHIAQPPLSQQIRKLEQELGVTLFKRTKRRVELTPAGRAFAVDVRRVFAQTERAVHTVQRAARGESGELSIGFVPSADLDLLPRVLRAWRPRFPHVELELRSLLPAAQIEALLDDRIQVAFLRLPVADERGLVIEPIQREPLLAALPRGHRLARQARVRLSDLAGETMILFPRDVAPEYYDVFISACRRAGFTPKVLHPGSMQTNLGLVSAGLGVALMPASIQKLRREGVVYRPLRSPVPHVEMAIAYRAEEPSAVLTAFLDVLHDVVRQRRSPAPRRA